MHRLVELTSRQQETRRGLPDWLRMEYAIERPSNELLAAIELDPETWVAEGKYIQGMKRPPTDALRDEYTRTIAPSRALTDVAAELNDQVYRLFNLMAYEIKLPQKQVQH